MTEFVYINKIRDDVREHIERQEKVARTLEENYRKDSQRTNAFIAELRRVLAAIEGDPSPGHAVCIPLTMQGRLQEAYNNAKKIGIREYTGYMLKNPEDTGGNDNQGYIPVDDINYYLGELTKGWAWACTEHHLTIDARDVLEAALEDEWYEHAIEDFDVEGLQSLLDKWLNDNKSNALYLPDYSVVVDVYPLPEEWPQCLK